MPVLQPKMLLIFEILLLRPLSTLSRTGKDILVFYIYSISYWKKKKKSALGSFWPWVYLGQLRWMTGVAFK